MNLPVEVIEAVRAGRCVLFAGGRFAAEVAEAAGQVWPDDAALAAALGWRKARTLPGMGRGPTSQKAPTAPSVLEGARLYEAAHGRAALEDKVRALIGGEGLTPGTAHRLAAARFPLIFTTGVDRLWAEVAPARPRRTRGEPVPEKPGEALIYALRGDDGALCLTRADLAASPLPGAVGRQLRSLIRSSVVFFVGYKPDEEEFELLWEELSVAYGGELPRCHMAVAQGRIDDYLWQKWVWRGLLMFTADPGECLDELERHLGGAT